MKIIETSNHSLDYYKEELIKDNLTQEEAKVIQEKLNENVTDRSSHYYSIVANDYILSKGFEP